MVTRALALVSMIGLAAHGSAAEPFDAAAAFGARADVAQMTLSPDGRAVAYLVPTAGPGTALLTLDLAEGSKAKIALVSSGKPERIEDCHWVSNERLVCEIFGINKDQLGPQSFTRLVAVDRAGTGLVDLSDVKQAYGHYKGAYGGEILDWLPDTDGKVLMDHWGEHGGLGVVLVDTRSNSSKYVEWARNAAGYISDGRGNIRIRARHLKLTEDYQSTGHIGYEYRRKGSRDWLALGEVNEIEETGFEPVAVDPDKDVAYGYRKKDGRWAIYSVALDGSRTEQLVYARPDVDVMGLFRIGRHKRVVGVSYATDMTYTVYLDGDIERLMNSLSHALPDKPALRLVDTSLDEQVLLIHAGSDEDPGVYYLYDRHTRQLRTFFVSRDALEGRKLARMQAIQYPAADGVMIPAYLTLPPGKEDAKGLPAIVLPHGGPTERDYWGFDWLSQYFAARGYAVLQPNFRGSAGYGDAWIRQNGFKAWRIAVGDVLDAGHWLKAQGIADPARLAIVGWSYGGYAALQSAVMEPGLFKAVVAIAPVTDLEALQEAHRQYTDFLLVEQMVGEGPQVREGSPAKNADRIRVPVLLFHGALDLNVEYRQSRLMAERLTKAGVRNELVTWDYLDHQLEDSSARAQMLRQSDEFLRQAFGDAPPPPGSVAESAAPRN
jgi:dipeptidyl aminopeptidase/acylaminoacyl peptidase